MVSIQKVLREFPQIQSPQTVVDLLRKEWGEFKKNLLQIAKNINKRNKEVEKIFKKSGVNPPRKVSSDTPLH